MSNDKLKPIVVIGGGGHASVLVDILRSQNREILAIICPNDISERNVFSGIEHLRNDADVLNFSHENILLVNGIGMLPRSDLKQKLNQYYLCLGYKFATVIATSAQVSPFSTIESGVQIFAGAIIQAGVSICEHSVINSGVILEHDCKVGTYNHIAPRATLCGQVSTGNDVFIGAGATIIQNIEIEHRAIVGSGALVTKNLATNNIYYPSQSTIHLIQR
ncbi:acetyltransferase [Shewanella sp. 10N.7]|uniref:acetyltransferase n=1 Tax=Shewanella sp. 10N.7 TaxID=2885093 RepID=UPI001E3FF9D8|nr:acetyltransferase [Shewanella sp. 10N.7]MCC4831111.1 acetyltransferase [Shewanella sp. 10N.7]